MKTMLALAMSLSLAHAASAQQADTERPPDFEDGADEVPCDLSSVIPNIERCSTPRDGVLSGGYMGFDVGAVELSPAAAERIGVGLGVAFHLRLGLEFWDHIVLGFGLGGLYPSDERPTTEEVVDCYADVCDETNPYSADSSVGTEFLSVELGGQHRFRPSQGTSIVPGALLGLAAPLRSFERGVDCDGCSSVALDAEAGGLYAVPFVRFTFGRIGEYATVIRSQWFLSGDIQHASTIGFEYGLP